MISKTFLFLAFVISYNVGFGQTDSAEMLSDSDLSEIRARAVKLMERTGIAFWIEFADQDGDPELRKDQASIALKLDMKSRVGTIHSNIQGKVLNQAYFDRLVYLYIKPGYKANNLKESIIWMVDDVEKAYQDEQILKVPISKEVDSDWNLDFLLVLCFFILIGVSYVIKTLHKVSRGTNKAEFWQYYGYHRTTTFQKVLISILVIGFFIVFIFQFVFYYEDVTTLYILLAIISRPLVLFGCYLFVLIQDYLYIKKLQIKSPGFLSLGQKMFLLKSDLKTEEYILLEIYELLVNQSLLITAELKDPNRPGAYRNFLSLNPNKQRERELSSFQKLVLSVFPSDEEKYFLVHDLVYRVMDEVLNYKVYKKDFMAKDLLIQGFILPKSWVVNSFLLSPTAIRYRERLSKEIKELRIELDEYLYGAGDFDIHKRLIPEMLLVSQSEKKIDDLYNRFANEGIIEDARRSKLGVLLETSFSFWDYRGAIRRQIKESYETRSSSWLDE